MRYTLENENLKVEIDSFGAEIKSVKRKSDNFEYMWCGDKKYWGRTSPVLFPFVGAPKNKEYRYDGKTYTMGQHGFARDMEFTLEAQTEENISFVLTDTAETCEKYPFHFALHISYELWKTPTQKNYIFPSVHIRHSTARFTERKIKPDMVSNLAAWQILFIIMETHRTVWR